jgi:asparaginyl-tRNA synthetase
MKIEDYGKHLSLPFLKKALKIHSDTRKFMGDFLKEQRGFIEIPPVIISGITDPLNHPTTKSQVEVYGYKYELTKSMIFHKQIALHTLEKVFAFSPNVRLEPSERKSTGRHLIEFTQIDVEQRNATREDVMDLAEDLVIYTLSSLMEKDSDILESLGRKLVIPKKPFKKVTFSEALEKYGDDFEEKLSRKAKEPFWLIDIHIMEREFYDREDPDRPGILRDMDLIYPEGFGEASSGGEREFELGQIYKRIDRKGQTPEQFKWYIEFAQKFGLIPSAGFGIGIERFVRFATGAKDVRDVTLFPKAPGEYYPI